MHSANPIHSYSKVYNLGHPEIGMLFQGEVVVQEKIDGSQFSFMLDTDGQLHFRSKGAMIHEGTTDKLFAPAVEAVISRRHLLTPNYVYRGEVLCRPKHNTIEYKRVPSGFVILFDIDADGSQNYFAHDIAETTAAVAGFEFVPLLHVGIVTDPDALKELLTRESCLGGPIEGVVIKNYREFGRDHKVLMGKHVREAFKEAHKTAWRQSNPTTSDVIETIGTDLRTEARFRKAVEHLRDAGRLTSTPKDIGPLLKELQRDLQDEMYAIVADRLVKHFWPHIQRKATAGFAEWYKDQLLQHQQYHTEAMRETTDAVVHEHNATLTKLADA